MSEVLVKADNVSKKFCRSLKKSLWYGMQDLGREVLGRPHVGANELRLDEFWAVNDVSFELKRGECLGLIGANGAGKSTLLKMLNGLIKPDKGRIEINGRIGALIELGAGFNPILTGRENIYVNGSVLGFSKKEIDNNFEEIVDFAEIKEFIDSPVQNYSSGMKVRLGFAVAAQMEPDVLLVDEVLAVGDMGFKMKCMNRISQILPNTAVIIVSHSMPQISRISTSAILLINGECLMTSCDVPQVISAYNQFFSFGKQEELVTNGFKLQKIMINDQTETKSKVSFGEQMVITMHCHVASNSEALEFRIIFRNEEQYSVLELVSDNGGFYKCVNDTQNFTLKVVVPSVILSSGVYTIVVVVSDEKNKEVLCRVENAAIVNVESSLPTYSQTIFKTNWFKY